MQKALLFAIDTPKKSVETRHGVSLLISFQYFYRPINEIPDK